MPTYEYECRECGHHFEVFQSMSDDPLKTCVECGKEVRRLIFGGTGVIFKGSGFYVTDKAGGKSRKKTESASSTAKTTATSADAATATATAKSDTPANTAAAEQKAPPAAQTA